MDNKTAKLGTCGIRHTWKRERGRGGERGELHSLMLYWHFEFTGLSSWETTRQSEAP
jgi:hypothetical protein